MCLSTSSRLGHLWESLLPSLSLGLLIQPNFTVTFTLPPLVSQPKITPILTFHTFCSFVNRFMAQRRTLTRSEPYLMTVAAVLSWPLFLLSVRLCRPLLLTHQLIRQPPLPQNAHGGRCRLSKYKQVKARMNSYQQFSKAIITDYIIYNICIYKS